MSLLNPKLKFDKIPNPISINYFFNASKGTLSQKVDKEEFFLDTPCKFYVIDTYSSMNQPDPEMDSIFSQCFDYSTEVVEFRKEVGGENETKKYPIVHTGAYSTKETKDFCKIESLKWQTVLVCINSDGELCTIKTQGMITGRWMDFVRDNNIDENQGLIISSFEEVRNPKKKEETLNLPVFMAFDNNAEKDALSTPQIVEIIESTNLIEYLNDKVVGRAEEVEETEGNHDDLPS